MAEEAGEVRDNREQSRFEMEVEGRTAILQYTRRGGTLYLTHTEVPAELEGRGIGSRLARHALEQARGEDLKVAPWCPFVRAYVERHPEYQPLVAQGE